ncbi:hypothetical protein Tco_1360680 [Tanacetum coccineum]
MIEDFLLRKVAPLALPREGDPAIKLGCESYASCMVAAFGRFGSFRVLGLGPLLILWSRLAARLILYVIMSPQSSVSSVRVEDVTRLKFAQFLAVSGLMRESSQLFIFPYFHCLMRDVDTCLNLGDFGFSSRGFSYPLVFAFVFEMVGSSIYTVTFVLTQRELDHHCSVFNIPADLRPELPDQNAMIKYIVYKVSYFEIMFRVLGRVPIVDTLRRFYVYSISNWWLSFSKRGGVDDPCCYSKKFDSLKNWNNWFSGLTLRRSFIEPDIRPTLLHSNDEEIGLLDFVNFADPFKVKTGERTLAANEVPLVTETEDRVISPSPQTISLVDHTIQDELNVNAGKRKKRVAFVSWSPPMKKAQTEGVIISKSRPSTARKSPTALWRLIRQSGQADTGSGTAAPATKDATSYFVTPTPEYVLEDDNVVLPVSSAQAEVSVPVIEPASDGRTSSAPELEAGTLSATPNNPRDAEIVDLKARLEKSEIEAAEVIKLRKRVSDLEAMVAVKLDCKVAQLTADCDGLRGQVMGESKMQEKFVSQQDAAEQRFSKRAAALDARIADVRCDMYNDLYPHMLTAIAGRTWVVGHNIRLAVHKCACSVECRSALGKVISMAINKGIQQGLEAGVVHGKASRSLTQIKAYDLEIEGKSLKDFPLALIMSALTLKDDHGHTDATPEFHRFQPSLDHVTVPIYSESGSIDHEMLLSKAIYAIRRSADMRGLYSPSSSTVGGASGSAPPYDSSLGVAD